MSRRVLAIVVTHNPRQAPLVGALEQLVQQACLALVVDNASSNAGDVAGWCEELANVEFLPQSTNQGLGKAHNIGIQHAREKGYDYVLLMDQDSIPMPGMLDHLLLAHQRKSKTGKVSATGVMYLNADNGSASFFVRFGWLKFKRQYCSARDEDGCVPADFLISSGSLLSLKALAEIGDMDESLFIDHVDTEWFLRARHKQYTAWGVCEAKMQHGLGEQTHQLSLAGRRRNVPQHKPFRYYYIFRNSVLLYKRRYVSWMWKWNDLQRLGMIAILFGLFKPPRRRHLAMISKGIWHGVKGVTGSVRHD